jgi:hypothetical protein
MDAAGKVSFINAVRFGVLRRNAGNQHRLWLRQIVICRFAVKDFRLANDVEIGVGTNRGKLCGAIQRRAGTERFVVMEEECALYFRFVLVSFCPFDFIC